MKKQNWRAARIEILHSTFFILHLPAKLKALGEALGQAGVADFLLGGGDVVVEAAQFDRAGVHVINDVAGLGIVVAGLADGAHVDEIFFGRVNFKLGISSA